MALDFGQIEPSQLGQASRFDIPFNEWVGVQFGDGWNSQLGPRLTSFIGDKVDTSPLLSTTDANAEFGIPGYLNFDAPVRAGRAREMRERKDAELKYAAYHESALHSWLSPKAAIGQLAALAGGSLHPVDFAVNFLPFVGSGAKAANVAKAGGGLFRQGLARGLITQEAIAGIPILSRFPNYSRALIEATRGNAALESPNFYLARRNQEDYDETDFVSNVFLGGIAGATIATGIRKLFKLAHFGYERLHGETRDASFNDSMGEHLSGESRPVAQRAAVDEQAIRDSLAFDGSAARADVEAIVRDEFRTATAPELIAQARALQGVSDVEASIVRKLVERFEAGERNPALFESLAALLNRHYDAEGSMKGLRTELHSTIEAISRTEPLLEQASPQTREQIAANIKVEQRRNTLADDIAFHQQRGATLPVQREMARRVEVLLKQRRAEAQAMVEGKISEARAQALEADIAAAKTMNDEQVAKFAATMEAGDKVKFLEADTAAKAETADEAIKNLEDYADRLEAEAKELEAAGKEDMAKSKLKSADILREQLKDAAKVLTVPDKAIDAARPCITGL